MKKTILITLLIMSSISTFAEDSIKLIGKTVENSSRCELHLIGDYEMDDEAIQINDAAIVNELTNDAPLSFDAIILLSGHNFRISIGHKNLNLKLNKDLDIESYVYRNNGKEITCNLSDSESELDADF